MGLSVVSNTWSWESSSASVGADHGKGESTAALRCGSPERASQKLQYAPLRTNVIILNYSEQLCRGGGEEKFPDMSVPV